MEKRCKRCGCELSESDEGHCSACLLRLALSDDGESAESETLLDGNESLRAGEQDTARRIGPYELIRKLGEGGMGEVYLARQHAPVRRDVALKLVKHHAAPTEILGRFEVERQALALMDHPAIAKIFDAGESEDGRPYFAMEYVDGLPITEFCDAQRLGTRARLELIRQVCDAVQHAHAKGVIHRDLKPSNILVSLPEGSSEPLIKVIDFGIAKATNQRMLEWTAFTEWGRLIGTPEYMSPEQADTRGQDVDIRTDVYSIGVVLYELLVGSTPHDVGKLREAGLVEMVRVLREEDPPTPSVRIGTASDVTEETARQRATDSYRLARQVRGELDWIVMKSLRRDREHRYGTVRELSDDIGRHLTNQPVLAGPPSLSYRASKFVRRHRWSVAAGVAALAVLVVFAGLMSWTARRVALERDKARQEAETAERVTDLMVDLFEAPDPDLAKGEPVLAREILDRGYEQVRGSLVDEPEVLARLLAAMGWAYRGLGEYSLSAERLREAREVVESIEGHDKADLLFLDGEIAATISMKKIGPEAGDMYLSLARRYAETEGEHSPVVHWFELSAIGAYEVAGEFVRAAEEARRQYERHQGPEFERDPHTMSLKIALAFSSHAGQSSGIEIDPARDREVFSLGRDEHDQHAAHALTKLGLLSLYRGEPETAAEIFRDVVEHKSATLGETHSETLHSRRLLSDSLLQADQLDAAIEQLRLLHEVRLRLQGEEHPKTLGEATSLANALVVAKRHDEAETVLELAIAAYRERGVVDFQLVRAEGLRVYVYNSAGRYRDAKIAFEAMIDRCSETIGSGHLVCLQALRNGAFALRALGDEAGASALEAEAKRRRGASRRAGPQGAS